MGGGQGPGIASGVIYGGFLCVGLFMLCIAAAIVLSLIPTYPPNHSQEGFGSEYQCDSVMLKFVYENFTYKFSNGIVGNSTALSNAGTEELAAQKMKNVAGVLFFNGRAWDAANTSTNSRRRRRQSQASTAGMYYIGTALVYRTTSCAKAADRNKSEDSTSKSSCVTQGIKEANGLVNDNSGVFILWSPSTRIFIEVADTTGAYQSIGVELMYGVPRSLSVAISSNLPGVTQGTKDELQRGCRYVRSLSITAIDAILASQTSSNNQDITTVAG